MMNAEMIPYAHSRFDMRGDYEREIGLELEERRRNALARIETGKTRVCARRPLGDSFADIERRVMAYYGVAGDAW